MSRSLQVLRPDSFAHGRRPVTRVPDIKSNGYFSGKITGPATNRKQCAQSWRSADPEPLTRCGGRLRRTCRNGDAFPCRRYALYSSCQLWVEVDSNSPQVAGRNRPPDGNATELKLLGGKTGHCNPPVAIGLPNSAKVQGQLEPKALVGVLESVPVARHIPETAPVEASPRLGPLSLVVTDQNCCRVGGCIDEVVRYGVDPWSLTSHTTQIISPGRKEMVQDR
jgi:hypothetical protein